MTKVQVLPSPPPLQVQVLLQEPQVQEQVRLPLHWQLEQEEHPPPPRALQDTRPHSSCLPRPGSNLILRVDQKGSISSTSTNLHHLAQLPHLLHGQHRHPANVHVHLRFPSAIVLGLRKNFVLSSAQ